MDSSADLMERELAEIADRAEIGKLLNSIALAEGGQAFENEELDDALGGRIATAVADYRPPTLPHKRLSFVIVAMMFLLSSVAAAFVANERNEDAEEPPPYAFPEWAVVPDVYSLAEQHAVQVPFKKPASRTQHVNDSQAEVADEETGSISMGSTTVPSRSPKTIVKDTCPRTKDQAQVALRQARASTQENAIAILQDVATCGAQGKTSGQILEAFYAHVFAIRLDKSERVHFARQYLRTRGVAAHRHVAVDIICTQATDECESVKITGPVGAVGTGE